MFVFVLAFPSEFASRSGWACELRSEWAFVSLSPLAFESASGSESL